MPTTTIRRNAMKAAADKVLKDAVSKGDVPGVVATATDAKGTTYEGGFGKRMLGEAAEMTPDTVVWIASMTKAVTGAAAMQLVERGKLSLDGPAKDGHSLRWARSASWKASTRRRQAQDAQGHSGTSRCAICSPIPQASATTSGARDRQVHGGDGGAGHHLLPGQGAHHAAAVRSRRALALRHQHRLRRQDGRGGERPDARQVHAGQPVRAARHDEHGVPHHRRHAQAHGQDPSSRRRRCPDARPHHRDPAGAGVRDGRRRALQHGRRLPRSSCA